MEKPELEKILKKLEKLDLHRWEWKGQYYGPAFIARMGYLTFYLSKEKDHFVSVWKDDKICHFLTIENEDKSIKIVYSYRSKSTEEIEIKNFYEKLRSALKESREKRFEQSLNEFLSE